MRHYVPDMNALAALLLDQISGAIQQRVATVLADTSQADPAATVTACLAQLLPLDDERAVEFAVWRYFWGRNRDGVEAAWVWTGQRVFYRQMVLVLAGRPIDGVPDRLPADLEAWAEHLHAFVDGLALRAGLAVPADAPAEILAALRHGVRTAEAALGRSKAFSASTTP